MSGIIDAILIPSLYHDESAFTTIPAGIGGLVAVVPAFFIGGTAHIIGYGLGLPFSKEGEFGSVGAYTGFATIRIGSSITGAPFYALEKVFHELPESLIERSESNSPELKVPENSQNNTVPHNGPEEVVVHQGVV